MSATLGKPAQLAGQRGLTLVEVLVSVLILSFGLLGMVGLQSAALHANHEARIQSQATGLARELAEMMRGNSQVALQPLASANPYLGEFAVGSLALSAASHCLDVANAGAGCDDTKAVASAQMTDWLARVDSLLPQARVSVCFDASPFDEQGLPRWTCGEAAADGLVFIKMGWTRRSMDATQSGEDAFQTASGTGARPSLVFPVAGGQNR